MSLKDSMLRGLALYGASTMAQGSVQSAKVIADIINDSDKVAR